MERDEYASRYSSRKRRRDSAGFRVLLLWVGWLPLTVVGALVGRQLGLYVDDFAQAGGLLYAVVLVLRGALIGAVAGGLQGLALWDYLQLRGWLFWTGATAAGWAAHGLALYYTGGPIVNTVFDWGGPALPLIGLLTGLVGGLTLGVAQAFVVRRARVPIEPVIWALACTGGAALGRVIAGFAMNFDTANSLVAVAGFEALGVGFLTAIALADGIRKSRAAAEATVQVPAEIEEQRRLTPEPDLVKGVGEWLDVGHGLTLSLVGVDIGDKVTWHLAARNGGRYQAYLRLDPHRLRMSDSMRKVYRISGLHIGGATLAPGATTHLEVQADILSYAPIPSQATYLDLIYTPPSGSAFAFREPLPAPANR